MKVYIVTSGEYSDYGINKVFLDREKARFFQMINYPTDGYVEEYEVCDETISDNPSNRWITVKYFIVSKFIELISVSTGKKDADRVSFKSGTPYYILNINIGTGRLYNDIIRYGRESKMLQKIVQDRFAEYLYEHGTTREKIIKRADNMHFKKWGTHPYARFMATTAMPDADVLKVPLDPIAYEVNGRLRDMIEKGQKLPDNIDSLYKQVAEELNKIRRQDVKNGGGEDDT